MDRHKFLLRRFPQPRPQDQVGHEAHERHGADGAKRPLILGRHAAALQVVGNKPRLEGRVQAQVDQERRAEAVAREEHFQRLRARREVSELGPREGEPVDAGRADLDRRASRKCDTQM